MTSFGARGQLVDELERSAAELKTEARTRVDVLVDELKGEAKDLVGTAAPSTSRRPRRLGALTTAGTWFRWTVWSQRRTRPSTSSARRSITSWSKRPRRPRRSPSAHGAGWPTSSPRPRPSPPPRRGPTARAARAAATAEATARAARAHHSGNRSPPLTDPRSRAASAARTKPSGVGEGCGAVFSMPRGREVPPTADRVRDARELA